MSYQLVGKDKKSPLYRGVIHYWPRALKELARLSDVGRIKHQHNFDRNNVLNDPTEMYTDAIVRHLTDIAIEGEINSEDGTYHRASIVFSALSSLEQILKEKENETTNFDYSPGAINFLPNK